MKKYQHYQFWGICFLLMLIIFWISWLARNKAMSARSSDDLSYSGQKAAIKTIVPQKKPQVSQSEWKSKPWLAHLAPEYQGLEVGNWWKAPISFYGRVVDENSRPIIGATIEVIVSDISVKGTTHSHYKSDQKGLFAFTGKKGKGMTIKVVKLGYYETAQSIQRFDYGGEAGLAFRPDPEYPVEFQLYKKGLAEPLIVCSREVKLDPVGDAKSIDLFQLIKTTNPGSESVTIRSQRTTQFAPNGDPINRYTFSVTGGGLALSRGPYDFWAPESGYENPLVLELAGTADRQLFVRFNNGNYARLSILFGPSGKNISVTSYINPDGSRNLECDPQKTIKVRRTREGLELQYPETTSGVEIQAADRRE